MSAKRRIKASGVRFIKLGRKGEFERDCIESASAYIRIGFRSKQHRESLAGDWEAVSRYWTTIGGKTKGKATEFTNQVRAFYTLDESTLWITFYQGKLFWCFASSQVDEIADGSRTRRTLGPWSCCDIEGHELHYDNLSGALTKVQGFRGTICTVNQADYLIKRINCELMPDVSEAISSLEQLERSLAILITKLGWKDFELLCDLIFTRAGWQRVSAAGKTQKTIDLELISPVSGKRAAVQVKSQSDLDTFLRYKSTFEGMSTYDEVYFAVHTPSAELAEYHSESRIVLLTGNSLAKLVVSAGLANWLIRKVS